MPIFMDRHDLPGATAVDIAIAHQKDLRVQTKYRCQTMTYWFDERRAVAFCLIEAPDADAVMQMHNEAHGMVPNVIIEVESRLVEAFLGRITDPPGTQPMGELGLPVFEDAAFRTILAIELKDIAIHIARSGDAAVRGLLSTVDTIVARAAGGNHGNGTTKTDDLYLLTFSSTMSAVECAKTVSAGLARDERTVQAGLTSGMGICAGDPVTSAAGLFGDVVRCARRMAHLARENRIFAAPSVGLEYRRESSLGLTSDRSLTLLDREEERLLSSLIEATESSWNEGGLRVDDLARRVGQSKSQLYRKLTALTGCSPMELLRELRLRKAGELLATRRGNVTETAFETGFGSAAYFSKLFSERFGILPSTLMKPRDLD